MSNGTSIIPPGTFSIPALIRTAMMTSNSGCSNEHWMLGGYATSITPVNHLSGSIRHF
jgi:hypothetical protein